MTLSDFIMDTIKEVLAEEDKALASSFSHVPSSDPTLISTPGACGIRSPKGKRRLVTEKMIVEAFESGAGFTCSENDLLTPSAKDALQKYRNK